MSSASTNEDLAAKNYNALRKFLGDSYENEKSTLKGNDAHYKFMRLSTAQFQEATINVVDELVRRQQSINGPRRSTVPSFLPPREGFPESYNRVRRRLASLEPSRFRELAMDVCYELEQRFPQFSIAAIHCLDSPPNSPTNSLYGGHARDSGKLPQENTVVSSKASFIEDESDNDAGDDDTIVGYDNDSRSIISGPDLLQSTKRMTMKERKPPAESRDEVATLRGCIEDLRSCVEELRALIKTKDEEIRSLKIEREETEAANTKRKNGGISKMLRGI